MSNMQGVHTQPRPGERVRAAAWLLGVLVLVVGCLGGTGYGAYRLWGAAVTDDQEGKGPAQSTRDLEAVCYRTYYPEAPAYSGPGPHPIAIFIDDGGALATSVDVGAVLPPGTSDEIDAAWAGRDFGKVQIVACATKVDDGERVKTCGFEGASEDMKKGVYELTVREVKTRKKVATTRITGASEICPGLYDVGNDPGIFSEPSSQQLVEALKPHVEK
jgi:hypothetical protein